MCPLASSHSQFKLLIVFAFWGMLHGVHADESHDYFEREVRPILVDHCQQCHGTTKQESDLRLDSLESVLKGGVSGAAVVPGDPAKSLLIAAIRHEQDLEMPPKGKLPEAKIAALTHWVKIGAPWPKSDSAKPAITDARRTHWAFQPVRDPAVPKLPGQNFPNPIDAFVHDQLAAAKISASPPATRRQLIRRATFDLTGLPPTPEAVAAFERDSNSHAYEQLIEQLLARPQYGEQWARHWLDIARYSDTKGYVYGREQRFWIHAWVYRDWVVQALNDDMPYDRFVLLQIAADQAAPEDNRSLAALGFLTLGRRFQGVARDIIDDRIDVVTRGTMGLTVGCARCHDHKYDPIPTRDYYSLYGVFQSCLERVVPISEPESPDDSYRTWAAELEKRRNALADGLKTRRLATANRNRSRVEDYLAAQLELHNYPEEGFDQILEETDLLPNFVRRWQMYLAEAAKHDDPVFVPWHAYAGLPPREFAAKAGELTKKFGTELSGKVHSLVAQKFATAPASLREVAVRYGELFADVERQWQELQKSAADQKQPAPSALPDPAAELLRQVLYSPAGPCEVPDEPIVNIEYFVDSKSCDALWKLQNELDNWILQSPQSARHAIVLNDREVPTTPRVFKRGNPANKGDEVPRQFVEVVAGANRQPFTKGSGRLELAQAIVDPQNPLTARVIVNRVWAHHFGAGLVPTPSDFGTRAEKPSHPELLDWLASRFIEDGWSLKQLHRRIMTSETYRQSTLGPSDETARVTAKQIDPENRLLWRMNERRLSFEEMRDALLASSGLLDPAVGGRAADLFSAKFTRRTLYGMIDRQFLPSTLRIFDFANPDLHIPERAETTVPQQALFFLNHPLMVSYAQAAAKRSASQAVTDEERVQLLYQFAYQRPATTRQVQAALEFVKQAQQDAGGVIPPTVPAWQYGFGAYDEASQRVTSFEKLPHFTGSAWQGGTAYPDGKLGWAQLTATGGHPGNDLAHAVIRRWTAPQDMSVRVESVLQHEPKQGEGVRGFLVSSSKGLLKHATVHNGKAELNADWIAVQAGDTLDFVADIGKLLSYNQFLWRARIIPEAQPQMVFDSVHDFENQGTVRLEPWEQLAQVILSANEFVFVD